MIFWKGCGRKPPPFVSSYFQGICLDRRQKDVANGCQGIGLSVRDLNLGLHAHQAVIMNTAQTYLC